MFLIVFEHVRTYVRCYGRDKTNLRLSGNYILCVACMRWNAYVRMPWSTPPPLPSVCGFCVRCVIVHVEMSATGAVLVEFFFVNAPCN